MEDSKQTYMMWDTPPIFGDTLPRLEEELEKIRKWPDTIMNKQAVIAELEEAIAWKKAHP